MKIHCFLDGLIWSGKSAPVPIRISSEFTQNCLEIFSLQNFEEKLYYLLKKIFFVLCYGPSPKVLKKNMGHVWIQDWSYCYVFYRWLVKETN